GVELACLGGELVVECGQLLLFDLLDLNLEDRMLAAKVLRRIVGGEIDLDRSLLASASADELLLEPLDQTAAAELEHVVPCLAALKRLIIDLPDEVDHDEIAFIGRPFDALDARKRFAEALHLAI